MEKRVIKIEMEAERLNLKEYRRWSEMVFVGSCLLIQYCLWSHSEWHSE